MSPRVKDGLERDDGQVQFAYVDESGNSGYNGSRTYTLGCVLVDAQTWPDAFDGFIAFRRFIRARFRLGTRLELKASWLVRGSGSLAAHQLGDNQRYAIYRAHMRLAAKLRCSAFAIVIDKGKINNQTRDPRDIAWEYLFQRLERWSTANNEPIMLIHDEGEAARVRGLARKARRANVAGSRFGTGTLRLPARLLVEDPVPRNSAESYFIQLADLCAYAAYRRLNPPPPGRTSVCPQNMWDELGTAINAQANYLSGGPPGIVSWP